LITAAEYRREHPDVAPAKVAPTVLVPSATPDAEPVLPNATEPVPRAALGRDGGGHRGGRELRVARGFAAEANRLRGLAGAADECGRAIAAGPGLAVG